MKKFFLHFVFFTFVALSIQAQVSGAQPVGERIRSLEIGYLTKQLRLTPIEAEKFWPIFNQYRNELKGVATNENITDDLDRQQKVLDIRKKYKKDFAAVLDNERSGEVYAAEDRFRNLVRREINNRIKARQEDARQFRKNK